MLSLNVFVFAIKINQIQLGFPKNSLSAPASLDVLLARADSRDRVALRTVLIGAGVIAAARLAPLVRELVMVGRADLALIAGDTRLALAFALRVALEAARAWITKRELVRQHDPALL